MVSGMCVLMFLPIVRKTRKSRARGKEVSSIWYMLKVRCLRNIQVSGLAEATKTDILGFLGMTILLLSGSLWQFFLAPAPGRTHPENPAGSIFPLHLEYIPSSEASAAWLES